MTPERTFEGIRSTVLRSRNCQHTHTYTHAYIHTHTHTRGKRLRRHTFDGAYEKSQIRTKGTEYIHINVTFIFDIDIKTMKMYSMHASTYPFLSGNHVGFTLLEGLVPIQTRFLSKSMAKACCHARMRANNQSPLTRGTWARVHE